MRAFSRARFFAIAWTCAWACAPAPAGADSPLAAATQDQVAQGLAPFAQLLGDWEGPAENMAGNFTVAKRFQWLVPHAWLLEQTVTYSLESGGEVARTALLYTYDAAHRAVVAELLLAAGGRQRVYLSSVDGGTAWEVRPEIDAPAQGMFRSTLLGSEEWEADTYERSDDGTWRQVEHMTLRRKH